MLIYIDDSGDPGFKFDRGSSRYFVMAAVVFLNEAHAKQASRAMDGLRRNLGWHPKHEFKFSKLSKSKRIHFLRTMSQQHFVIRAVLIHKETFRDNYVVGSKDDFYNFAIKELLEKSEAACYDASLFLDGHGDRIYKKAALRYFKQELETKDCAYKKMRFVDSKTDNLIQLADMVAGTIFRSTHKEKEDHKEYISIIADKFEDLWDFN